MIVAPGAPAQVRRAFILLWTSLVIGVVEAVYETAVLPKTESYALISLTIILGFTVAWALVVYFAARRRNWARYVLLLWTVGGLVVYALYVAPSLSIGDVVSYFSMALEVIALYWLFTSPGKLWYRA